MFVNSDFSDLLSLFNAKRVRYMVIGGYAVVQHGEPRYTNDLDLWISTEATNTDAVYSALRDFGVPLSGLTPADFREAGSFYQMGVPPNRVDILMSIPGVDFQDAWKRRVEVDFDGLPVSFICREDLISAKQAAGRPQDLIDLQALRRISRRGGPSERD